MSELIALLLVTVLVLATYGVLHLHPGQPCGDGTDRDADERRINHDLDAIRTRFEQHAVWPSSGVLGERR
jgi:hypothetical protein